MTTDSTSSRVFFRVAPCARMQRVQVLIRLALFLAIGAVGCSSVYWLLYLVLPTIAALLISQRGPSRYLAEDAPRLVGALRWFAAAYAYLWLLTDALPTREGVSPVEFEVQPSGTPTAASAMLRVLCSLPALVILAVLSMVTAILWPLAALSILVSQRPPTAIAELFAATLQYQLRLFAYHLSLVDLYPASEAPATRARQSRAV
ncbi:MAG: DUF4389 domain-containing protein [Myxococcota bacterium]|nr:DUF4389 domain-containing protein [Myxococcota bacterium]